MARLCRCSSVIFSERSALVRNSYRTASADAAAELDGWPSLHWRLQTEDFDWLHLPSLDVDLQRAIASWSTLPKAICIAITALVGTVASRPKDLSVPAGHKPTRGR